MEASVFSGAIFQVRDSYVSIKGLKVFGIKNTCQRIFAWQYIQC